MILTISVMLFIGLILATGAERIYELVVSTRNAKRAFESGGVEYGRGHLPAMIALHTALLIGAMIEVIIFDRQFLGAPGWTFLAVAIGCQAARYWFIWALGSAVEYPSDRDSRRPACQKRSVLALLAPSPQLLGCSDRGYSFAHGSLGLDNGRQSSLLSMPCFFLGSVFRQKTRH